MTETVIAAAIVTGGATIITAIIKWPWGNGCNITHDDLVTEKICAERVKRIEGKIDTTAEAVTSLHKDMTKGFDAIKKEIQNGNGRK